jgi:hypothetical protein
MSSAKQKGFVPILILVFVLAVAGVSGIYFYWKNTDNPQVTPEVSLPTPQKDLTLTLESPTDGTLATDGQIMVKGKTLPNTTVAFYTDIDDGSIESDSSGNFMGNVRLGEGINTLTVTAFSDDGNEKTTSMDVVYDKK